MKINLPALNEELSQQFSQALKISKIFSQLLVNRGITNISDAEKFILTKISSLNDPYAFADMQKAVDITHNAAKNKKRVMIFGDYDVDGITSVALLKKTLKKIGVDPLHYIPHRVNEGYGLSKSILHIAQERKIDLVITVDCGTSSHEQVDSLRTHGIEVIITDHHEPSKDELPNASAIINPKVKSSRYPFRDLAGVGVVFKLCQALTQDNLTQDLDLVTLGTIADVVPLVGENRIIVKHGLNNLASTDNLGIKALIESSGIRNKKINSTFVSYILGPRLNASGRMSSAETSLQLLLTELEHEAEELAKAVEQENRKRQKIEAGILEEALDAISKEVNFNEHKVIVVAAQDWHQGVLGIVASKIADRFYRPTIVISLKDGLSKGSGRSIKNFHLFHALLECSEFLDNFGGHSHAVGLVIDKNKVEFFRKKINAYANQKLSHEDLIPSLDVDIQVNLVDLSEKLISELEIMEPFGTANPKPLFLAKGLKLKGAPQVLARETLKFWVTDGKFTYQAIGFGKANCLQTLVDAQSFDLIFTPKFDTWQANNTILLETEEILFNH